MTYNCFVLVFAMNDDLTKYFANTGPATVFDSLLSSNTGIDVNVNFVGHENSNPEMQQGLVCLIRLANITR